MLALLWAIAPRMPAAFAGAFAASEETLRGRVVPQSGHSGSIRSVAISPDGKRALSGSDDKTLRNWELSTGREIRRFEGHADQVGPVTL